MRTVMRVVVLGIAAMVLAGCASTSNREVSPPTATPTTTPTATPTVGEPPQSTRAPRPSPQAPLLTRDGLGGVPVGATLDEFAKALGRTPTPMSATDRSVFTDHSCVVRRLARLPGVGLMVIGDNPEGSVRRITFAAASDIRTDAGIGPGSNLDAVRAAYGPGLDEPFDHFPVGGDAVLVRAGGDLYLAFITDNRDRVVELRLGFKPEVLNPEGCV